MKKLLRAWKRWNAAGAAPDATLPSSQDPLPSKQISGHKTVSGAVADPEKIVLVSPAAIRFKLKSAPIIALRSNNIQPGEWDLNRRKIEESAKFNSVLQHFRDGLDWENTDIFRRYVKRLGGGEIIRGCRTIAELRLAYQKDMSELYESLKESGFLSHHLRDRKKNDLPHVYIARDGEILFGSDGNHRLAMARLLNFAAIACRVMGRHADWQALREKLFETDINFRRQKLSPALADHPDLQDLLDPGTAVRGD